jgi:hypothetical protein
MITVPGMTVSEMATKRINAWPRVSTGDDEAFEVGRSVMYCFLKITGHNSNEVKVSRCKDRA